MRIHIFAASLLATLLAAGCAATISPPVTTQPMVTPGSPPAFNNPTPGEPPPVSGTTVFGDASVDSVEFRVLESFPVQIIAVVRGNLPDGCTQLGEVTQTRTSSHFVIHIATIRLAALACTDALRPYEQNVPLEVYGLSKGVYTVDINGYQASFELQSDNVLNVPDNMTATPTAASIQPTASPSTGNVIIGEAEVDSVKLLMLESFPVQITAIVRGTLPDNCTHIGEITQARTGSAFTVKISTVRPKEMLCTLVAMVPYEQSVALDVYGLPKGVYSVDVNGYQATFELQSDNILNETPPTP